jgi:transcriptional regulator with XRE-family HTH domain
VDEAIRLDRALRAKGKIFAGFVAFTQHTAFEPITPIMHQVLGFSGFAQELSSLRRRASLTLEQLAEKIKEATGILILPSLLCHWEQGFNLPSLNMEKVVAAMDVILLGNENLKRVWKDEGPREMLPPYALPYDDKWPERVRKQFDRTADYKGDNPEDLDQSPAYGGDRWTGTASKNRCIKILERYFGYLVNKLGYKVESLSLTLIADWDQVQAFFNFVKERVKRDTYSQDAVTITNVFCNLWAWYLPHLVDEAAKESYWDKRLPTHATGIEESVPGVAKSYQVELLNFEERWNYHLVVIHDQAREFLRESHFKIGSLVGRAAPMQKWDGDWSIVPVLMEKLVRRLPRRILCREAAILCRDLVAAVLSLAHLLRPGTMISLCNKHITPQADGRVWLDIPEKLMKPRGHGGSKGGIVGPLAEFDFMHEVVRRYIVEARPLLVAEGTEDLGNFLTPAYVRHANADGVAGVPLSEELLRHALVCILGYPGYGHRHVGATVMDKQGESLVKIAGVLGNLPPVALRHYIHRTAESKTAMLNALAEQIGSDGEPA